PVFAPVHAQVREPLVVALQQLVLLAGEDAGNRERRAGLRRGREGGRQFAERAGEDVGDEYIGRRGVDVLRQEQREPVGDAVALGVVGRGGECLRVVVDADRAGRAKLQRGDRQDAGAAAVIGDRLAGKVQAIQPFQAQRGGG